MAAENAELSMQPGPAGEASMRPRRMAAENVSATAIGAWLRGASMRPRRMAAENRGASSGREPITRVLQ